MSIATPSQSGEWFTASQLADLYPKTIGRLGRLALQRLATLAASIAKRQGIRPRRVIDSTEHWYKTTTASAYPLSIWMEARGLVEAPAGLKAQPTEFNGVMFRSRLEARTARFFSSMELEYEYEPECLELPSGRYIPDFRVLLEADWTWFEIKHQREHSGRRDPRWSEAVLHTNCELIVSYGLWRPVPFEDSGPARMYRGSWTGGHDVPWSEITSLYPEGAANEISRQQLIHAYRDAADERFGD